ncbi:hypothetical protein BH11BAC4_BH11BAC4_16810 [soil metagenome]
MKIEQLIGQHLYNSKKVSLQDIGTFILSPEAALSMESDKESNMPENAVRFEVNKKATQDEELINFIVAQTRKIKPLATSDLESYSILAKQFLNIGKPFPIDGLGVLLKNQAGDYEFTQGSHVNAKLDAAPALLKEKANEEISFSTKGKAPAAGNKKWMIIAGLFFIVAISAALYYFLKKGNKDANLEKIVPDTTASIIPVKDTAVKPVQPVKDTTAAIAVMPTADSIAFNIVIREYSDKATAEKMLAKFSSFGHKLVVHSTDSTHYQIAMPFINPATDSLRARDSLKILFGGKPYVEKK